MSSPSSERYQELTDSVNGLVDTVLDPSNPYVRPYAAPYWAMPGEAGAVRSRNSFAVEKAINLSADGSKDILTVVTDPINRPATSEYDNISKGLPIGHTFVKIEEGIDPNGNHVKSPTIGAYSERGLNADDFITRAGSPVHVGKRFMREWERPKYVHNYSEAALNKVVPLVMGRTAKVFKVE